MIRVEGLTKDYGPRRAIHELTFDARQGEILGFLGPNGAGKDHYHAYFNRLYAADLRESTGGWF